MHQLSTNNQYLVEIAQPLNVWLRWSFRLGENRPDQRSQNIWWICSWKEIINLENLEHKYLLRHFAEKQLFSPNEQTLK